MLVIAFIIFFTLGSTAAFVAQFVMYPIWIIGSFIYIVVDSKSRWPEASAFQRFANAITFKP
jgi:hypothetical protein